MKNKIFILLILILTTTVNAVWINQVYYDPAGSETYGEAIELYNPLNESVDISEWIIWTTSSEKDVIIPKDKFIEPNGYFLIADQGWSEEKDNETWRNADLEDKMTLKNTNGGVAIKNKEGTIIDAVGWGDGEEIPEELFEGKPAEKVEQGETLFRLKDSEDNSQDFIAQQAYFFSNGEIIINTRIKNESEIQSTNIIIEDDDKQAEGIQISPKTGGLRKIKIITIGLDELIFLGKTYELKRINGSYQTEIEVPYYLLPGIYTVYAGSERKDIEILPIRGLTLDKRKIDLTVIPGSYETKMIKIKNTGNIELKIYSRFKEQNSGKNKIKGSINVLGKKMSEEWTQIKTLRTGETSEVNIDIYLPEEFEDGNFKTILSFKGE